MVSSARTFWGLPKLCHILLLFGLTCCVSLHIKLVPPFYAMQTSCGLRNVPAGVHAWITGR